MDKEKIKRLNQALLYGNQEDILFCLRECCIEVGMSEMSKRTGLAREALYKMLDPLTGNPQLDSLFRILRALGLEGNAVSLKSFDENNCL